MNAIEALRRCGNSNPQARIPVVNRDAVTKCVARLKNQPNPHAGPGHRRGSNAIRDNWQLLGRKVSASDPLVWAELPNHRGHSLIPYTFSGLFPACFARIVSHELELSVNSLVAEYYSQLRGYARRMLRRYPSVRRWEETDDVVQLSLIRLLRALQSTRPDSELHFRRLASLQVRRMLIDLARSLAGPNGLARNYQTNHGKAGSLENVSLLDRTDEVDVSLCDWEEFHLLVDELDRDDRDMFDLIWYSGLDVQQAAKLLNITPRSAQRRWRKARLAVARAFEATSVVG